MRNVLEFTAADLDLPKTRPQELAAKVLEMFDGTNPVRTIDVARVLGRDYGTVKTQLHVARRAGLLKCMLGKGWLPPA